VTRHEPEHRQLQELRDRPERDRPEDDRLDRLRRSGFRIDRDGELKHDGELVRHEGLRSALFRWLDRLPDGRFVLRLDTDRFAYIDVDDTPLVARAARIEGASIFVALSDGTEERLDPATLHVDRAGGLRCLVRGGRLEARLTTSAAVVVAELVEDQPDGSDGPLVRLGNRTVPSR